ncbi:sensor domain-containing diguanylate cyclase [Planococcus sp. ISL-109]|uniref:sensor domain-containing diguanylate cyclase n=1 Tax=Planococcus sp. ISL-109 TaxID=2819166 RepID=UPI001BE5E0FF|nr:sensor domain-containing diguanylate cyclase [Planococcus sp. ISL-109]MBT2582434.1 GGDEF domain-containing protein [Planococcus sp. ISL-109]
MDSNKKRQWLLWMLWALVVPAGLYLTYQYYPPEVLFEWELVAFAAFAVVTALLPLNINGTPMYLVQWVTIAVFLKYGLFIEILMSQLTMLVLLFRTRNAVARSERFTFNSLMFFVLSAFSGLVFFFAGGEIGSTNFAHIVLYGLLYQLIYLTANHLYLYADDVLTKSPKSFISLDSIWDFLITLLIFPYAITLYVLDASIGVYALVLLGLPFMVMTVVLRLYNSSEKINIDLKKAGNIGHQLADRLSQDEVIDQFIKHVATMFKTDYAYVIDYRKSQLLVMRIFQDGRLVEMDIPAVPYTKGIAGQVIAQNAPLLFGKQKQWIELATVQLPKDLESIMATPISRNNKIEGVLLVGSRKEFAFSANQLQIMEILSTYFAVSLEKAGYMENVIDKSERCGLTKLYNYRYLDETLERCMKKIETGALDQLSLIMMDIDWFKGVNDKYGHQSGNEILIQLADLLKQAVGEEGTLARYGGEEFVVLLPHYSKELALVLAENLRKQIAETPFTIQQSIQNEHKTETLHITMSIGVSTAPEDGDDGMAIIRNADRALYTGAKQAGRNRVAAYTK